MTSSKLINPKSLKKYLEWWDKKFIPILERNQFALLGISFIVNNPPKFQKLLMKTEKLEDVFYKKMVFRILDEMEQLARRDLMDFLKTHNIHLPVKHRDKIIDAILEKTGGNYDRTVCQLQKLVDQHWDDKAPVEEEEGDSEDDYDY